MELFQRDMSTAVHLETELWTGLPGAWCHKLLSSQRYEIAGPLGVLIFCAAPLKCGEEKIEPEATLMEIAQAYNVECASILINGPSKSQKTCAGKKAALDIFQDVVRQTLSKS